MMSLIRFAMDFVRAIVRKETRNITNPYPISSKVVAVLQTEDRSNSNYVLSLSNQKMPSLDPQM